MPKFETNRRKIIKRLQREGWTNVGGGRHDKFVYPEREELIIVPRHKEVSIGVARDIAENAGWTS